MSELNPPRVSVGMPVYNGERFLRQAIKAILGQTLTELELVICDNASTDGTERICREFAARDARVRYHRNERNIGANANFNRVFAQSHPLAEYFRWASHDDLCAPNHLEACVMALDADPTAVLCFPRPRLIDVHGRTLSRRDALKIGYSPEADSRRKLNCGRPQRRFADILLRTRWCFEVFGVIRRSALARTAMQENYYGTDKVILAALALAGPFCEVPGDLFWRRCHGHQSTSIRSVLARARWSDPNQKTAPVVTQLPCLRGYLRALDAASLFSLERLGCRVAVLRYLLQGRKLASLARDQVQGLIASIPAPTLPTPASRFLPIGSPRRHQGIEARRSKPKPTRGAETRR